MTSRSKYGALRAEWCIEVGKAEGNLNPRKVPGGYFLRLGRETRSSRQKNYEGSGRDLQMLRSQALFLAREWSRQSITGSRF